MPPGPSGVGSSGAGSPAPDVTVVVVTWQGRHLIEACLDSLSTQTAAHRVVVVDNASTDGTAELVRDRHPEVALVELATNTGFAGGVAAVLDQVETRYLALLNNDAEADPTWLREATAYLGAHPEVAAVSSRMLLADVAGTINNAGVLLLPTGYGADRGLGEPDGETFDQPVEVFAASGGAGVYRTLAVKAVGGIEPRYFMYYEDTDLSWRLRLAGWTIAYCPTAVVHHRHAASSAPGSPSFAFHTERNRLLTLARCAPPGFALAQTCRFVLTTASLTLSRLLGRAVPDDAVVSPAVRLRALASVLRLAPQLMRVRATSTRARRAGVLREWRGVPQRPTPPAGTSA